MLVYLMTEAETELAKLIWEYGPLGSGELVKLAAENLGWIGRQENRAIAETLKRVFAGWLGNGHTDPSEETTCILRIHLDTGTLFSHGTRYDISFRE